MCVFHEQYIFAFVLCKQLCNFVNTSDVHSVPTVFSLLKISFTPRSIKYIISNLWNELIQKVPWGLYLFIFFLFNGYYRFQTQHQRGGLGRNQSCGCPGSCSYEAWTIWQADLHRWVSPAITNYTYSKFAKLWDYTTPPVNHFDWLPQVLSQLRQKKIIGACAACIVEISLARWTQ